MHWSFDRKYLDRVDRVNRVDFDCNILLLLFLFGFQGSTFNLEKHQKHLLRKIFSSPHTITPIYLVPNCFLNYVYLKDMYITLK